MGAVALAGLLGVTSLPAGATLAARSNRLAGDDRYGTAMRVAEATFESAPIALLANGLSYADALSANYLSGGFVAPLLLTGTEALPPGTVSTLQGLGTERVLIVGGTAVVSDAVEQELERNGLLVNRISGADRYETSRLVARTFASSSIGTLDGGRAAIVATGQGFADALAAAPLSASRGVPIVLTPQDGLHDESRLALQEHDIVRVVVVGGPVAVSEAVIAQIRAMGIGVRRIAGASRYETALDIATFASEELDYAMDRVLLSRGDSFADAVAAGTRGGRMRAPLLLVAAKDVLGEDVRDFIGSHVDTLSRVDVFGGTGVITREVEDDAVAAAQGR